MKIHKDDKPLVKIISKNRPRKTKKELTYIELLNAYKSYAKREFKITYYLKFVKEIDNYYSTLFNNIVIRKLTYADVENARKTIKKRLFKPF